MIGILNRASHSRGRLDIGVISAAGLYAVRLLSSLWAPVRFGAYSIFFFFFFGGGASVCSIYSLFVYLSHKLPSSDKFALFLFCHYHGKADFMFYQNINSYIFVLATALASIHSHVLMMTFRSSLKKRQLGLICSTRHNVCGNCPFARS